MQQLWLTHATQDDKFVIRRHRQASGAGFYSDFIAGVKSHSPESRARP